MSDSSIDITIASGLAPAQPAIDARAAAAADVQAASATFDDYRSRLDPDTLRRQEADLALFAHFLAEVQAIPAAAAPHGACQAP